MIEKGGATDGDGDAVSKDTALTSDGRGRGERCIERRRRRGGDSMKKRLGGGVGEVSLQLVHRGAGATDCRP